MQPRQCHRPTPITCSGGRCPVVIVSTATTNVRTAPGHGYLMQLLSENASALALVFRPFRCGTSPTAQALAELMQAISDPQRSG